MLNAPSKSSFQWAQLFHNMMNMRLGIHVTLLAGWARNWHESLLLTRGFSNLCDQHPTHPLISARQMTFRTETASETIILATLPYNGDKQARLPGPCSIRPSFALPTQ